MFLLRIVGGIGCLCYFYHPLHSYCCPCLRYVGYDGRYQLPIALFGLISCLALWDVFKSSGDRWGLDRYPVIRQTLIRIAQCGEFLLIRWISFAIFLLCIVLHHKGGNTCTKSYIEYIMFRVIWGTDLLQYQSLQ